MKYMNIKKNILRYSKMMNIFIGLQKYLYKDFFKISKLELLLISLGSEFQNLMADA